MPDQLYRRCPDCRESASGSSCPTCGGERFIPARLEREGPTVRWRIRIGTLMLLVVIAGLASYIVADLWHRAEDARLALERDRAVAEALLAEAERAYASAAVQQARASVAQPQAKEAPTPASAGPTQ